MVYSCSLCGIHEMATSSKMAKHYLSQLHVFNEFYNKFNPNKVREAVIQLDDYQFWLLNKEFVSQKDTQVWIITPVWTCLLCEPSSFSDKNELMHHCSLDPSHLKRLHEAISHWKRGNNYPAQRFCSLCNTDTINYINHITTSIHIQSEEVAFYRNLKHGFDLNDVHTRNKNNSFDGNGTTSNSNRSQVPVDETESSVPCSGSEFDAAARVTAGGGVVSASDDNSSSQDDDDNTFPNSFPPEINVNTPFLQDWDVTPASSTSSERSTLGKDIRNIPVDSKKFVTARFNRSTNQNLFLCKLCQKEMTGDAPLEEHMKSKNHERMYNRLQAGLEKRFCEACNVTVPEGEDNWRAHVKGANHLKRTRNTSTENQRITSPDCTSSIWTEPKGTERIASERNAMIDGLSKNPSSTPNYQQTNTRAPIYFQSAASQYDPYNLPSSRSARKPSSSSGFSNFSSISLESGKAVAEPGLKPNWTRNTSIGKCVKCGQMGSAVGDNKNIGNVFQTAEDVKAHVESKEHSAHLEEEVGRINKNIQGTKLTCFVCKNNPAVQSRNGEGSGFMVDLSDKDSLNEHLRCWSHVELALTPDSNMIYCILCLVCFNTHEDYCVHLNSDTHDKVIQRVMSSIFHSPQRPSAFPINRGGVRPNGVASRNRNHETSDATSGYFSGAPRRDDALSVNSGTTLSSPPNHSPPESSNSSVHETLTSFSGSTLPTSTESINYSRCDLCNAEFSGTKNALEHYNSKKHKTKVLTTGKSQPKILSKELLGRTPFVKSCSTIPPYTADREENLRLYYEENLLVKDVPRHYQHDLYRRIMCEDVAFFCCLPTGLGKTLIACLVMVKMLELNQYKSKIFFVVDKVLLARQQLKYIRAQLSKNRRKIHVGVLHGQQQTVKDEEEGNIHLRSPKDCDIIVITADFLKNLLDAGSFNWLDACCVVFDEVHHCDAKHPFRKLVKEFHTPLINPSINPSGVWPKLIGLTASPASDDNPAKTFDILKQRLEVFGKAKLVTVSTEEIEEYRYVPTVEHHEALVSHECKEFSQKVAQLAFTFIKENGRAPFMRNFPKNIFTRLIEIIERVPSDFPSWIFSTDKAIEEFKELEKEMEKGMKDFLAILSCLFEAIFLANNVNLREAFEFLRDSVPHFNLDATVVERVENQPVSLQQTTRAYLWLIQEYEHKIERNSSEQFGAVISGNRIKCPFEALMEEIHKTFGSGNSTVTCFSSALSTSPQSTRKFLLTLTKTRLDALSLTKVLDKEQTLIKLKLSVGCVVGHGCTSANTVKGMSVNEQNKALNDMKTKQIFVATSVAEEGIDVPECEKVIMFNAPKDTTAFVQIRGRARHHQSTVILIGSQAEYTKLKNLIENEKYMLDAVQKLNNNLM